MKTAQQREQELIKAAMEYGAVADWWESQTFEAMDPEDQTSVKRHWRRESKGLAAFNLVERNLRNAIRGLHQTKSRSAKRMVVKAIEEAIDIAEAPLFHQKLAEIFGSN